MIYWENNQLWYLQGKNLENCWGMGMDALKWHEKRVKFNLRSCPPLLIPLGDKLSRFLILITEKRNEIKIGLAEKCCLLMSLMREKVFFVSLLVSTSLEIKTEY